MSINKLEDSIGYLSGPIDDAEDNGIQWRRQLVELLKEKKMGFIKILDPTNKLPGLCEEVGDTQEIMKSHKLHQRWDALTAMMRPVVRVDLRQVDVCDFLIAYIDVDIHACGTYHEIVIANQQKKPILIISKQGKKSVPSWLFGILDHDCFLESVEECVDYLSGINDGGVPANDKWVLFRHQLNKIG